MTKKLTSTKPLMELDLNSFLDSDSDSDLDNDSTISVPHRTLDEIILNASDSSSTSSPSSSPPQSPPSVRHHSSDLPAPSREKDAISRPESARIITDHIRRSSSLSSSSTSFPRQLPLPTLFGGVRSNAKPGEALAAAAAASRLVPTPHAAIIKSRRASSASSASLQKVLDGGDDAVVVNTGDIGNHLSVGDTQSSSVEFAGGDDIVEPIKRESSEDFASVDKELERDKIRDSGDAGEIIVSHDLLPHLSSEFASVSPSASSNAEDNFNLEGDTEAMSADKYVGVGKVASDFREEVSTSVNPNDSVKKGIVPSHGDDDEDLAKEEQGGDDLDEVMPSSTGNGVCGIDGIDVGDGDAGSSVTDISELVEERIEQLETERMSKREEMKARAFRKPLELAEEFEKKQAYTGLHWEEGAAAQPMRLEGVKAGSTTLGYFDIDADNFVTRTVSSEAFRRDHGSPQVLVVHLNYIAVGMSRGVIVVVPSKYSAHSADQMDPKMVLLGSQGDRTQASVTSMCFNQQGDLLLAGYSDGHVTVWDMQRASAAKVITGEHTAPVVHTLFLGRDSLGSRQFEAVTSDSKGLVFLRTCSVVPLLNRFSVKTQCVLDGQKNGTVLSASPLLLDESCGGSLTSTQSHAPVSSSSLSSMMGGVVGVDAGWKLFNEGSSLVEEGVVIFVTYQTALVVRLSPNLEVYAQFSRPEGVREGSMPYTAWKCTMQSRDSSAENSSKEAAERVSLLAIAWDRKVQVAKLVKSELKVCAKWSLDSAAIGLGWLDEEMLVILTLMGHLCLFLKDGTMIHQTSFSVDGSAGDDLISYHTYFTNVFGNPEKAYHNSVAIRGASIYILGTVRLVISRLLPWKERIYVLRRAGDWMGALNMAMTLYDGQAHGVVDLPRTLDAAQEAMIPYLVELLLSFVDEVFSYISVAFGNQIEKTEQPGESRSSSSLHSEIKEQYNRVGGVAVEFCVHIKRMDILFDEIFAKFVAVQQRDTFLELLEPYILKDMLGSLPPEIMQALVEHYSSKGWLQRVEQCVLHMDISSLDFNQVVRICREHGLYGALVYLFNKGLNDFRSPLEELLTVLRNSQRQSAVRIGYRMLVYLKYCFLGLAFPPGHGTIPPTRLPSLRTELIQFLLENSDGHGSQAASSSMSGGVYLNLYHLLELDTEATLDVVQCAFVENETSKTHISNLDSADINLRSEMEEKGTPECKNMLVQNIVDALVHILDGSLSQADSSADHNEMAPTEKWPSKGDVGHLFEFVAYYVACGKANIPKRVLSQILDYLTAENVLPKSISSKKREKQLLTLLKVVPESDWDASYALQLCEKAQFYQVCGFIYTIRHQHLAALDSYIRDAEEPVHAFSFIDIMLSKLCGNDLAAFRSAIMSRIPELVDLSREGAFYLIIDHLKDGASDILRELHSHPRSLFLYLKTAVEVHLQGTLDFSSLRKDQTGDDSEGKRMMDSSEGLDMYLDKLCEFPKLIRSNPVNMTDDMIELYLELLCQFERNSVLKFLETFDSYRVEHCLRLCQEYGIIDAAAFLLERVGDAASALSLTLSGLDEKFLGLETAVGSEVSNSSLSESASFEQFSCVLDLKEVRDICDILHACIGLCHRNTPRLNPEESEMLWFRLLDTFCEPLMGSYRNQMESEAINRARGLTESLGFQEDAGACKINWKIPKAHAGAHILRKLFSQFIKDIVEGMIGYVRLPTIMSKLLSDNDTQEFGDFKLTILGMLGIYGFERRILDTAKSLIEDDTFYTMSLLKKGASHGYAPRNLLCCICNCPLTKNSSSLRIRVFNCGHATHLQCEMTENEASSQVSLSGCPVCMPKKNTSRSKSVYEDYALVYTVSSNNRPSQHITPYSHENDAADNSYVQQISRFEILTNLQKDQKLVQIESLPQLRLAPPAVYHEKVDRGTDLIPKESSSKDAKVDKLNRKVRDRETKARVFNLRHRFGKEKTGKR